MSSVRLLIGFTAAAALVFVAMAAACGGDSGGSTSGKAVDDVRAALEEESQAEREGDADKYLKHVTDNFLATVIGTTREAAQNDPSTFQNDDPPQARPSPFPATRQRSA